MMVMIERTRIRPRHDPSGYHPAMAPMTTQLMIPMAFLLVRLFASCWVVWRRGLDQRLTAIRISKELYCTHRAGVGLLQTIMMRILIVEDEEHLADLLAEVLAVGDTSPTRLPTAARDSPWP